MKIGPKPAAATAEVRAFRQTLAVGAFIAEMGPADAAPAVYGRAGFTDTDHWLPALPLK